jgi:hypothetical protein
MFFTKNFTDIGKPLAPMIRIDLDLPDGSSHNKIGEFKPNEFSAERTTCTSAPMTSTVSTGCLPCRKAAWTRPTGWPATPTEIDRFAAEMISWAVPPVSSASISARSKKMMLLRLRRGVGALALKPDRDARMPMVPRRRSWIRSKVTLVATSARSLPSLASHPQLRPRRTTDNPVTLEIPEGFTPSAVASTPTDRGYDAGLS